LPDGFPVSVLTPDPGTVGRCPVLTRVSCYAADQGVLFTLGHTVRGRDGAAQDLSYFADNGGAVVLRSAEVSLKPCAGVTLPQTTGAFDDPAAGKVYAPLSEDMVAGPGLYQLTFGVLDADGNLVRVSRALMSVEPNAFAEPAGSGTPTLGELRMAVRDSAPSENLLIQELEFGDDQLVQALLRPLRYFNEQPPPLRHYDTNNFPFREMWLRAATAVLYETAAAGYRRNRLDYAAGGVTVADQSREREYVAAADRLWQEWREFVRDKKLQLNTRLFWASLGSDYGP
jgi:hypothetical protein